MTVAQLILKLQEYDSRAEIKLWADRYGVELLVMSKGYTYGQVLLEKEIRSFND